MCYIVYLDILVTCFIYINHIFYTYIYNTYKRCQSETYIVILTTTYTCSVMRNIKSNRSVQINKSNLQPQTNTKPIYYYIGTRLGQILHARLRMQCSSFNHHLFRKKQCKFPILLMWGNRNHGPFSAILSPLQCNKTEIYSHH